MPSWQHRLAVLFLRLIRRKRVYASADNLHASLPRLRKAGPARPTAKMQRELDISRRELDGYEIYQLAPKTQLPSGHLLYLHGGAYVRPISRFHWRLLHELVLRTGYSISVPLYPLAPEHHCEQTLAFAWRAYNQLAEQSEEPPLLMGDSAGGGLALALALAIREQGQALPQRLLLICPWVDLRMQTPVDPVLAAQDPMLASAGAREAARLYAGNWPLEHPALSPLCADLTGLPAITLLAAGKDLLGAEALQLADKARGQGVSVDLQWAPEMIHVWPLMPTPEGQAARRYLQRVLLAEGHY
ncbi:alpha/beta hydrolase fold domain-containing protein [Pseudomonas sp. 5P_3.1_Bac2]|uniref:alpha/beta hydrolase fold domain-containing protein n=1 Tax=Pseudomonas sp. 5P_3.1_Bac2 TaxID=2971617 RepID=UPI0021CADA88|nr:alpha/beta hydrolase [Pseudomonas sp. 5P_3.1_Bac2]MCU1718265.1 alpha/beta hydrolase [Pseudomonas sp. 5P_3.1_Bac2]